MNQTDWFQKNALESWKPWIVSLSLRLHEYFINANYRSNLGEQCYTAAVPVSWWKQLFSLLFKNLVPTSSSSSISSNYWKSRSDAEVSPGMSWPLLLTVKSNVMVKTSAYPEHCGLTLPVAFGLWLPIIPHVQWHSFTCISVTWEQTVADFIQYIHSNFS